MPFTDLKKTFPGPDKYFPETLPTKWKISNEGIESFEKRNGRFLLKELNFPIYGSDPAGHILQRDFKLNLETGPATAHTKIPIPSVEIFRFVFQNFQFLN